MASAAATDTAPRIPVKATSRTSTQGGPSARPSRARRSRGSAPTTNVHAKRTATTVATTAAPSRTSVPSAAPSMRWTTVGRLSPTSTKIAASTAKTTTSQVAKDCRRVAGATSSGSASPGRRRR